MSYDGSNFDYNRFLYSSRTVKWPDWSDDNYLDNADYVEIYFHEIVYNEKLNRYELKTEIHSWLKDCSDFIEFWYDDKYKINSFKVDNLLSGQFATNVDFTDSDIYALFKGSLNTLILNKYNNDATIRKKYYDTGVTRVRLPERRR